MEACPACHGDGTITINRSRDPQNAEDVRCELCYGTGEVDEDVASEYVWSYERAVMREHEE
jgi:DnaJ-class molecular chaperone